jgi:hypothetical protein
VCLIAYQTTESAKGLVGFAIKVLKSGRTFLKDVFLCPMVKNLLIYN